MEERKFVVYKHTSPNEKVYIGITSQKLNRRFRDGKGYYNNKHFYNAIKKYGWDNFSHEVLFDNLTEEEAKLMEQFYIALYDSFKNGYNRTLGGEGLLGYTPTEETRIKLRNANIGKKPSPETIKKRIESLKNAWKDPNSLFNSKEFRDKMSKINKGKTFSEDTINKMRQSALKRDNKGEKHPKSKKVICITTNKIFDCGREASKFYNINPSGITYCCQGNEKYTYCGKTEEGIKLIWMYYDEYLKCKQETIENKIKNAETKRTGENNHNSKKIICCNTEEVFNTIKEAGKYFNIKAYSHIGDVCLGKRNYCGKLPDGTPLKWMYYEDYLKEHNK